MTQSAAIDDYLKAIVLSQSRLAADQQFVQMGEVAAAAGIAKGAATRMAKALADSNLVVYEPYRGVRLSPAGLGAALTVLRRQRLLELLPGREVGMRWDEAQADAARLQHAVSERIVEHVDKILGHPTRNQYGEPIPAPDGSVAAADLHTLLTCPVHTPLTIRQATDHQPAFLRFIEAHHLTPGQLVEVWNGGTTARTAWS